MASAPKPKLIFDDSCRDCGYRRVELPKPLPQVGDDFDWLVRDYDGFRLFMMEELAGRFPERSRWTPADIEVILVETLSVILDQFSDTLDRAQTEAFLDSARRPDSVRRLLKLIGYDAVRYHYQAKWSCEPLVKHLLDYKNFDTSTIDFSLNLTHPGHIKKLLVWLGQADNALGAEPTLTDITSEQLLLSFMGYSVNSLLEALDLDIHQHRLFATQQLEKQWRDNPYQMNDARIAGPRAIHTNRRMVTMVDYQERVEDHPAVLRAASDQQWTGSWNTLSVTVVLVNNAQLDDTIESQLIGDALAQFQTQVDQFHWQNSLSPIDWGPNITFRSLIKNLVDTQRMVGQEVWLRDAVAVGISIGLSIRISDNYFQSEIYQAVEQALGSGPQGFFQPGRLSFGGDVYASDLIEWLMAINGIDAVCINRFKRVGQRYADQSGSGVIRLSNWQIARCDNDLQQPEMGYWTLNIHGGQRG